jgi:hypothetical protein
VVEIIIIITIKLIDHRTNYKVTLDETELATMFNFFNAQHKKPYNYRGLICNFIPVVKWFFGTRERAGHSWFCSEIIMAALQNVRPKDFNMYLSSQTSIRDLHNIMSRHKCFSKTISTMGSASMYQLEL